MTNKYNLGNAIDALRILSLLLVLMLAPLSTGSFTYAENPVMPVKTSGSSKVANDIINPGLDPTISLSSFTASLFAAANSTAEVKVTSNITWSVSSNQSWLVVSPSSGTGNGTLTFTAEANKGGARTDTVSIWATGVAVQTIKVTQLQEIPSLTFSSSSSGTLSMYLQFNTNGTFYIDWGNGVQIVQTTSTLGDTYSTSSYISGNVVKIYGTGITNLNGGSRNLTSIDVSQCADLNYLYLEHNNLTTLNTSQNNKLTFLDCAYNDIAAMDVTGNTKLNYLSLAYNEITSLDVSRNSALSTLNCISNEITSLNVRNNAALTTLYCYSNRLTTLDVSNNSLLTLLYCNSNNLNFTTLPQPKTAYTNYNYIPQAKYPITITGNKVDISSQLKAADINSAQQTTVYKWYVKTGGPLTLGVDYSEANGVFTFLKTPSDSVFCAMTNTAYPGFAGANALRTVNIKVELVKPTVTTQAITGINTTTAVGNGNVTDFGVPNPTSYGVCWNKTGTPSITDTKIDLGVPPALGAFTANMTGLAPGTTYYLRAFATNLAGTSYGDEFSFTTTGILPTVNTLAVTGIGIISATGNGNIANLGAPNPTQYGVVWSTATNPTVALATKTSQGAIATTGAFASNITGLIPNTVYYVKAYATNTMGTSYGTEVMFTTLSSTISIPVPTSLTGFTALISTVSTPQTFIVGGSLVNDLVVTAPAGYEVRESGSGSFGTSVSFTPVLGVLSNKTIEVRLSATAPIGTVSGNVVCSSVGAAPQNVSVNGNVTSIQLTITNPTLTLTKVYDGTIGTVVTPGAITGIDPADVANVVLTATATYDNANAGTGKTITVKYAISGSAAYKYAVPANFSALGDITTASVTVNALTDTKTYDGTTVSVLLPTVGSLVAGDVVNAPPTQVFENANVGNTHILTPSGLTIKNGGGADVTGNYTINYASVSTGVINKLGVTVTAVTDTRVYNGTVISTLLPTVGSLASGDVVNAAPTQVFDNPTVGAGHVLTASGLSIKNGSGVDETGNYSISYVTVSTGVITTYGVAVTALTDTKLYDGSTASVLLPIVGTLAAGDLVNVAPKQVFDNSNVGTAHILTPSGLTIKNGVGTDVSTNYTISYVNSPATGVINKLGLTVTALTDTKTYDGTTTSVVLPTVSGSFATGDVVNTAPTQSFDNVNVGTTHILTALGLTIKNGGGTDVTNNYAVAYLTSPATGTITKLGVTVTALTDTKIYNGTTASSVMPTIGALAMGDIVNIAAIQTFDNANVGAAHVLTPSGLTIKNGIGTDVTNNYDITNVVSPATGVINKLGVTVTAVTDSRIYNGTIISTVLPSVGALATGDAVNTAPTQVYDNANAGTGHTLTASGLTIKNGSGSDVTNNYTISYVDVSTGVIAGYAVAVTAVTDTKTYDGTTTSTLLPSVGTMASGDVVNVVPKQVFDNSNVGNTHVLTPSGLTIKNSVGTDVTVNYIISYVNSPATGVINKLGVTVTALTDTKTYDGTTTSGALPTVTGSFATGDVVNTAPAQSFDNVNIGTTHILTPLGLTIKNGAGTDVTANYNITYTNSLATGVINKLGVTVSALTDAKIYNGTIGSSVLPAITGAFASGDVVNAAPVQIFDNANVGIVHVLTPSGLTIKNGIGTDVTNNYAITYVVSPATGVISKLAVIVTAVTDSRIYNSTVISTVLPTVVALAAGDVVNAAPTQVYDNANVGIGHTLTATGLTIKNGIGADMTNNYTISYVSVSTGIITANTVTVTALTDTKIYDGTTASVLIPTVGLLATGDLVNLAPKQVFDNTNVGNTHVLTPSGLTIKNGVGADVTANYTISYLNSPATGVITKVVITVTALTDTKTYNGTTGSALLPVVTGTLAPTDVVNAIPVQAFDNANVGTTHILTASGLTLKNGGGTDVTNNYTVTYVNSPATGVINKLALTVTALTDTKIYNGTAASAVLPTLGALATGDVVNTAAIQTFDNVNVGINHVLTPSGLTIKNGSGVDVTANYTISYVINSTGVINKLAVTVTALTDTRIYNGTMLSTVIPVVGLLAVGDAVNVAPKQVYDNASVGNAHVLTASGLTIKNGSGTDVTGNYTITYQVSPSTGVITAKLLTATNPTLATNKVYDGNTLAIVTPGTLSGVEPVDVANVTLTAIAAYNNVSVGTGKTITVTYGLTGLAAGNYATPLNYTVATGIITGKSLTVTNPTITTSKIYDGGTTAVVTPGMLSGVDPGDVGNVTLTATATYDNANAGNGKTITVVYGLSGSAAAIYSIPSNYSVAIGIITAKPLTVGAPSITTSKAYDGNNRAIVTPGTLSGVLAGDVANVGLTAVANYNNANAGIGKTITCIYGLTGSAAGNYSAPANYVTAGDIAGKLLTVTAPTITADKVYDGTTVVAITPGTVSGLEAGDVGNVVLVATATYDNAGVGNGKTITITYSLTGSAAGNYTAPAGFTITSGVIAGKPLTSANPAVSTLKVYDGTTSAFVNPGILSGVDPGDVANVTLTATAAYDNANVSKAKTITVTYGLTGSASAIYAVPASYTINTGEITGKMLTASDPILTTSKVYDGTTTAIVGPGVLSGIVGADDVNLTVKATYNNANAGTGKSITCTYTLGGLAAGNYIAPVNYVESNGTITGKLLVVAAIKLTTSKVYNGTPGAVFTIDNLTGVETADLPNVVLTGTATYDNANAGTGKNITIIYNLTGSASGNYIVPANYTITTGEITPKALTITNPVVVMDKMVDGNTSAVITTLGSLQGVETVDVANVTVTGAANYNSTAVGINKTITVVYTLAGTAKNNYQAPVNLLVPGAKISDNVTLSPLVSVTTGCEGSTMDLGYTILTGTPTQYQITFGKTAIDAGIQNVSYTNLPSFFNSDVLAITIPKGTKDGVYQGTLQMRNELGIESPVYSFTFTINVSTDFIVAKYDDVVLCDNSSNRFVAYQWYKDGVALEGATKQFYNDLDGLIGSYSLKLTTVDGQTLYTCPKVLNIPLAKKVSIYPSPVKANQNVTVKLTGMANVDLDGAELSIYTMQGIIVYHSTKVQKLNTIVLPPVEGMFVGKVTTSKGQEFPFKVIVVK